MVLCRGAHPFSEPFLGLEIVLRWWVSPTGLSFQLLPAGAVPFLMNGGTFSSRDTEIVRKIFSPRVGIEPLTLCLHDKHANRSATLVT
jgi:hypothetical protein